MRGTKGSTPNREEDFAERRSQWPIRWLASRLSPTLLLMLRAAATLLPLRCWARCSSRWASRVRRSLARLVRWMRTLQSRCTILSQTITTPLLPQRISWPLVCLRLPRRKKLRLSCVSLLRWDCLRRSWMVRRSVTRRWLLSRYNKLGIL